MDLGLNGKIALVLGSSSGLGFATAEALQKEGARVILSARPSPRLEEARKKLGAFDAFAADLTKEGEAAKLISDVIQKHGRIDILVTNAGGPPKGSFERLGMSQWKEGIQSLWLSAVESIQAALPSMRKNKWGRILLVTSVAAKEPMNQLTISNGLRAGLLGLCKSIATEVAEDNITINAILPGFTDTERLAELKVPREAITSQIPARRIGRPDEFASVAAFLVSDRASYLTGQAVAVDGGYMKSI